MSPKPASTDDLSHLSYLTIQGTPESHASTVQPTFTTATQDPLTHQNDSAHPRITIRRTTEPDKSRSPLWIFKPVVVDLEKER